MSVADKLGKGTSFGSVPRGRSARGRAKAVTQGDVPAYELVRLQLDEVSPTPLNPRRNFGTDEQLTRFGEELRRVQLAACVVVTRAAYLNLWADHEEQIGTAAHVLVNGERRYRSAVHVGMDALDFVVRDDLATTREDFIENLLQENLDREDFDVIERARGVQELVAVCAEENEAGAQTRAAERLGKSKAWVTNHLALLTLPGELQVMLSSGALAERDGRLLARHYKKQPELSAAQLLEHLKKVKEEEARAKQEVRTLLQAAKSQQALTAVNASHDTPEGTASDDTMASGALTAVNTPEPPASEDGHNPPETAESANPSPQPVLTAVNTTEAPSPETDASATVVAEPAMHIPAALTAVNADPAPDAVGQVPNQASGGHSGPSADALWDDPDAVYEVLIEKMAPEHRVHLAKRLLDSSGSPVRVDRGQHEIR
ncbi:ParB/RepB/Spo0J family partition protein [Streptomyces sp. NPDC020801]|uniref:ParB/RepB/Spo0J family partition protein n=1 Tax=Streptomyces sp. NPDC020801 TaxID=3365093 RepID=UPI0037AD66FD